MGKPDDWSRLPLGQQLLTDLETGSKKILEVREARPKIERVDKELGRFSIMWHNAMREMAKHNVFNQTDYRVRDYLWSILDYENFIMFSQHEMSKELGIAQPNISVSIKKLLRLGVIETGPSVGRKMSYKLNPEICWMGTLHQAIKEKKAKIKARKNFKVIDGGKTDDPDQMKLF